MSHSIKSRIAITLGDVNGVGPELLLKALARHEIRDLGTLIVFGNAGVLEQAAARLGLRMPQVEIRDAGVARIPYSPGTLSAAAGDAAHQWITAAVDAIQRGEADALVTCPISKEAVLLAGHEELGHTELLARLTGRHDWRMCLHANGKLVVHVSAHVPLVQAIQDMTTQRISETIEITHAALTNMGLNEPRIAVAGLNPHAGEHGAIGREDDLIIAPAVQAACARGWNSVGPISPDAVFRQLWEGAFDSVVAMYHDQGHIAMKMVAMDEGVSMTLGLPFPRTSPDHGTAFDIAGKGIAREDSLCAAILMAARMVKS